MRLGSRQGRRARLAAQYVLQWGTHDGQETTMADPDEEDLSPEEILREAETAFSKAARLFATGHQEKSIIAFTEALELYSQVEGTERQQADCLNNTGITLYEVGRYEEALTAYRDALAAYRTLPGTQRQQADCLVNTGVALGEIGRYEKALSSYRDALGLYQQVDGAQKDQADCLLGTGVALGEIGRYEKALSSYRDALDTYRTLPDTQPQQTKCLLDTGTILDEVGRYEEARTPFRRALTPAIISALKSNAARFQFPTEHDRITWLTERAEPSLDLALRLASINDQPALVSDLIATFRTGGSIDITRLATQNGITDPGQSILSLATSLEDSIPPTAPVPTGLALTASPPLGADAVLSANIPRRPGPILHMPYHRTALADYRSDDDTTRPHARYR